MSSIYKVRELTQALKSAIEGSFPFVWVQGQVSNLSRPQSGHLYFSLKDEEAALAAVWFKSGQQAGESFDPLTGEVYADGPRASLAGSLENGDEVICAGRLTVYPPRGTYQLVVELMQEAGKGRLQIEFELLKAELAKLGYFDQDRKMALPPRPCRVAVVTSPSGAAIHDFLRIAGGRGLPCELRIHPTPVQGEEAPAGIAAAIEAAQAEGWAEVIVLIRGGGALEDLWAFNTRPVVEAIYRSRLPVLCGVGHEVDVTLADLAADVRAATPSHAAQILLKERRELAQRLDELDLDLHAAVRSRLQELEYRLAVQEKSLYLLAPLSRLEKSGLELDLQARNLGAAMRAVLSGAELALARLGQPERPFAALERVMLRGLEDLGVRLNASTARLSGLDPELPLSRGYALVRKPDGGFLRRPDEVRGGDELELILSGGSVPVAVRPEHDPNNR